MYRPTVLLMYGMGLACKEEFLSQEGLLRCRVFSYQGLMRLLTVIIMLKNLALAIFMLFRQRNYLFVFVYVQIQVSIICLCYAVISKRHLVIKIMRQLEANARPNEHRIIFFLSTVLQLGVLGFQLCRNVLYVLILSNSSQFEKFVDRFWFESAGTNPLWLSVAFTIIDLIMRSLFTTLYAVVLGTFLLFLYHVVLQFDNLRNDIKDGLSKNETVPATTAQMVDFRRRFANIVEVIKIVNELASTGMTVISFQFGIFCLTFIVLVLRNQTMAGTQTESFESIGLMCCFFVLLFPTIYIVFRLDDLQLYPVTEIRKLSVHHALDDEEFFVHSEGLVDQMLSRPSITFARFFALDRKAFIRIFGAIGSYFMSVLSIDQVANDRLMSLLESVEFQDISSD